MTFTRSAAERWHLEVPGARWFKADLHIHTIDDLPGDRAKVPDGVDGRRPVSDEALSTYARKFLQSAAARDVHVMGVTPHSPRLENNDETSAVWRIVEEWNTGVDDDGKLFRDKIYAVFPGFEPALKQGKRGLHLLFLFDPEVGRDSYMKAFNLAMGGVSPWRNKELQISSKSADEVFRELREFHGQECPLDGDGQPLWDYISLAPHIDTEKGLLGELNAQVLRNFPHSEVTGLELGDQKLPEDTIKNRDWLADGMAANHLAFFHGSDAYSVEEIGKRHTWLKLASPRIEALRQAFIASDSRIRIGYERNAYDALAEIANPPDVTVNQRPWLKSVTVSGGASFFDAGKDLQSTRFELNPDLTCIIGGSMTGKSTFLDGLRLYTGAPLPHDDGIRKQVETRGRERFLGGSPEVELDCPGQDPIATDQERWPAVFFGQNELQQLTKEEGAVEELLARLVPSETPGILSRKGQLKTIDNELDRASKHLAGLDEDLTDAEQAFERTEEAVAELAAFSQAGVEKLHQATRNLRRWKESAEVSDELKTNLDRLLDSVDAFELPEMDEHLSKALTDSGADAGYENFQDRWSRISEQLRSVKQELTAWKAETQSAVNTLEVQERQARREVDHALAAHGLDGARIEEFQALNRQASLFDSYKANLDHVRNKLKSGELSFEKQLMERQNLVEEQRASFDRVIKTILAEFGGRISPRRVNDGNRKSLDRFLENFRQRGITRWWNDLNEQLKPSPRELLDHLGAGTLGEVGMSDAVRATFREHLTRTKQRHLAAIRCSDLYVLELEMDDGSHRQLDDLSGGQQVSLLLSLLLETSDERPLVIDQPEDELDNRFLFDTVLPALKRLKGRRQIIVATHNANIVVNGDADQVIQLEATANRGRVACAGAIEEPAVRDAIVRTVDGGDEAFRLRRLKYGF